MNRNQRFSGQEKQASTIFTQFLRKEKLDSIEVREAIKMLKGYMSSDSIFEAADCLDLICTLGKETLDANLDLRRKVDLERLKRAGYLGYDNYQKNLLKKFCCDHDEALALKIPGNKKDQQDFLFYFDFFIAIGQSAWIENNEIGSSIEKCNTLTKNMLLVNSCQALSSKHSQLIKDCHAFLNGLEARHLIIKKQYQSAEDKFESGWQYFESQKDPTTARLHYALQSLHNINLAIADGYTCRGNITKRLVEKFKIDITLLSENNKTIKPLIQISFLMERINLSHYTNSNKKSDHTSVEQLKEEALLLAYTYGFSMLEPLPPVLEGLSAYLKKGAEGFSYSNIKKHLKEYLVKASAAQMEKIASIYYETLGYTVEDQTRSEPTYDLILNYNHGPFHLEIGVQVKHWGKRFNKSDFDRWMTKAWRHHKSKELSGVVFFLSKDQVNEAGKIPFEEIVRIFPKITSPVQFHTLDKAVNLFVESPACLPKILAIMSD